MKLVKLRTGVEEGVLMVGFVTRSFRTLWSKGLPKIAMVHDLVKCCKDPSFYSFGEGHEEELKRLSLIRANNTIQSSVRNIILASVEGEGLDMKLVSPIAG